MTYINTEETKALRNRMRQLGYLYATEAVNGDEDAKEAFQAVQKIVDELDKDIRWNSRMASVNYNAMNAVMDAVRDQERDENGCCELPYGLANVLHAIMFGM